ncbi:hypothetical protein E2C01_048333 [Portunus trituberculatus]|uniref:Uncharacterized protein n=1 Tax=Portunus trituberculatus TaxID=210409 RepID=A0A5B7GA99_PORTR|nr:hypothetical protein [Portunus trituberculatus]
MSGPAESLGKAGESVGGERVAGNGWGELGNWLRDGERLYNHTPSQPRHDEGPRHSLSGGELSGVAHPTLREDQVNEASRVSVKRLTRPATRP